MNRNKIIIGIVALVLLVILSAASIFVGLGALVVMAVGFYLYMKKKK